MIYAYKTQDIASCKTLHVYTRILTDNNPTTLFHHTNANLLVVSIDKRVGLWV